MVGAICCLRCFYWVFLVFIFSLFWKENVVKRTTVQRNRRWICLQGRPHPWSNPHLIPLSNSGSSGRPIFHGGTVGRSEAELLPSKSVPRFFPLLSPLQVEQKNKKPPTLFRANVAFSFLALTKNIKKALPTTLQTLKFHKLVILFHSVFEDKAKPYL